MEYSSLDNIAHYKDCAPLVKGLGFELVDLKEVPQHGAVHVTVVICSSDVNASIGVNDCAKVHRALLARLEVLLDTDNIYMEVTSPGMERNIKNAAEFALFTGREVRVWDKNVTDWVGGEIISSDKESVTLKIKSEEGESCDKKILYADIAKAKFIHL